jgi:hypothetical protein
MTVSQFDSPTKQQTSNLINWLTSTRNIPSMEIDYLYEEDLCTPGKSTDDGTTAIEMAVERLFTWVSENFGNVRWLL